MHGGTSCLSNNFWTCTLLLKTLPLWRAPLGGLHKCGQIEPSWAQLELLSGPSLWHQPGKMGKCYSFEGMPCRGSLGPYDFHRLGTLLAPHVPGMAEIAPVACPAGSDAAAFEVAHLHDPRNHGPASLPAAGRGSAAARGHLDVVPWAAAWGPAQARWGDTSASTCRTRHRQTRRLPHSSC